MDNTFKKSIDRAIKLINTPSVYEDYIIIKIRPIPRGCCCFHCWPLTWSKINEHIAPFGQIIDEGDVVIGKDKERVVLECHESGPEIILYGIASGVISGLIVELIKIFLDNVKNEDKKQAGIIKITRIRQIKGYVKEEDIIEINSSVLSKDIIKRLNDKIKKALK